MSLSLKSLLQADKKMYYVSITQIAIVVLSIIFAILSIKVYPSIHLFKFLTGITYLLQPIMYKTYVARNYKIEKHTKVNSGLLKERWNGFANNLAYFIHASTDITILTFMTNLVTVSVYGVYTLVTAGLKSIIGAINTGVFASIGHLYARKDFERLEEKFDLYEHLYLLIVCTGFTVASLLITPFVSLYIGDKNIGGEYTQYLFGYLITIAVAFDLIKAPHVNLAYAANKFKDLTVPCFIEAAINIIVSIVLVMKYGLVGVAVGTICAMLYRIIYQVSFTQKLIGRKQIKFYKEFIVLLATSIAAAYLCTILYPIEAEGITIINWILHAIIYCAVVATITITISTVFFGKKIFKLIRKKK